MKVCIIQMPYSLDHAEADKYFDIELKYLDQCDETMDIIVLPEACDAPCYSKSSEERKYNYEHFNKKLLDKAKETAKRCNSMLFINANFKTDDGMRNTTYVFDRSGNEVGKYFKQHLTPGEMQYRDNAYSLEFEEPTIIEIEGIRFAFLTCYDFYFYESFSNIARYNVDAVIGCSHQRSDMHSVLEIMGRFLAYNTNSYLLRASVSMGEDSPVGGCSMIVAPDGNVIANMKNEVGLCTAEIDFSKKYYKPAGFGNPLAAHYEYIEKGRRPWKYRPGGSAIAKNEDFMPYPRICAFCRANDSSKENTMASFGSAIALDTDEIGFNIALAENGEVMALPALSKNHIDPQNARLEDILRKFSCHAIMNIQLDSCGSLKLEKLVIETIILINKYDCKKYVYFTINDKSVLSFLKNLIDDIPLCMSFDEYSVEKIEFAQKIGCSKVQILYDDIKQSTVDQIHEKGMRCNVLLKDPEKTKEYLLLGVDTLLTDNFIQIKHTLNN